MTNATREIRDWLQTPLGAALCEREQAVVADSLEQVVGLQLLQVGAGERARQDVKQPAARRVDGPAEWSETDAPYRSTVGIAAVPRES